MFCGLLLTVLGSRSDFQDLRTQGRVYVSFINTSGFLSILTRFVDYYSPFWGPEVISKVVEPQGALTCRLSALTALADFVLFCGLLLTDLGFRIDFQD